MAEHSKRAPFVRPSKMEWKPRSKSVADVHAVAIPKGIRPVQVPPPPRVLTEIHEPRSESQ